MKQLRLLAQSGGFCCGLPLNTAITTLPSPVCTILTPKVSQEQPPVRIIRLPSPLTENTWEVILGSCSSTLELPPPRDPPEPKPGYHPKSTVRPSHFGRCLASRTKLGYCLGSFNFISYFNILRAFRVV